MPDTKTDRPDGAVCVGCQEMAARMEVAMLDSCGIAVPKVTNGAENTAPRETLAIGTITKLLRKNKPEEISWALNKIPAAYGEKRGRMRASLIKALTEFRAGRPDCDDARVRAALCGTNPTELESNRRSYMQVEGGTSKEAMVKILERKYRAKGVVGVAA